MQNSQLQFRIMILGLLPGLMVSLVLGLFFISERFSDLDDLLEQRALAMAKQLAPVCEYGVMVGNSAILQNISNNMLEEPDVRSVTISNQDRQPLVHAGPRMLTEQISGSTLERGQLRLMRTEGSVRVMSPIMAQNLSIPDQLSNEFYVEEKPAPKILGWAELELSSANTRLLRYQYLASALSMIALVLIVSAYLAFRISRHIAIPMMDILRALEDLIKGKYETRVKVASDGELGAIASHLNKLASDLQRKQIEHQHSVETATRDLQENMDELEIRCSQLMLGKREAQETIRMKSEFLTNISHEIRTPLSGIKGYIDLLDRTQLNDRQRECLTIMNTSADDLMRMINDLLDLSKLEADKAIFEHNPFDLRDVLDDVMGTMTPAAINERLDLAYSISDNVPVYLQGDALRLKQVLTNLVGNGVKFTQTGSVTVRVSLINRHDSQASLEFKVRDTGVGMSDDERQRLFQPFSQADASTTRRYGGTGLGLIISRALVHAMHGDIKVTSSPGKGSIFSFHVTLDTCQSPEPDLAVIPGPRLAVLNSEEVGRDHLHWLLKHWQIKAIDCRTLEALYQLLDDPLTGIDGVLIAVDRDCLGTSLCQNLSARLQPYNKPLITLINSIQHDHMDQLRDYGASAVLSRPVNRRRLHQALSQLYLPSSDTTQDFANQAATDTIRSGATPPTVLAVDDNEANLRLVVTLLQDLDLPAIGVSSGEEAIRMVKERKIDLIFMDIQMPGMNGLETTRHIRSLSGQRHIPVIALTAHAMADERRTLLAEGMNDYQTKPISLEQLAHCVQQWTGFTAQLTRYSKTLSTPPATLKPIAEEQNTGGIFSRELALNSASGKVDLAADMLSMLLDSLPGEVADIREYWENDQLEALEASVHKLHGASRYCGVPSLRNSLDRAETALKQRHHEVLPERIRQLVGDADALMRWAADHNWRSLLGSENH